MFSYERGTPARAEGGEVGGFWKDEVYWFSTFPPGVDSQTSPSFD